MFYTEASFYLGEEKKVGYSGVIAQDNFFLAIEIYSGVDENQGHQIINFIKEKISQRLALDKYLITSLNDFDDFISSFVREKNLPTGFSLAAGYLKDDIFYLKTINEGKIFIRRKRKFGLLIEGDNTASGKVEEGDFFVLTTENFINLIGGAVGLEKVFDSRKPKEIIEEITPSLKSRNDFGAVSVFVEIDKKLVENEELENDFIKNETIGEKIKSYWLVMKNSKKTLTFLTAFFLLLIFFWSVILGYQRRKNAYYDKRITEAKKIITEKLVSAEDIAFLNLEKATSLIKESETEVDNLKKELGENKKKEVAELEGKIKEAKNKIIKKEEVAYQEFYDLSLEDKNVSGVKISLYDDKAFILDKKNGLIYRLSLPKKSFEKNQLSELKKTDLIAAYQDKVYFYIKNFGVYQIDENGKLKKVIEQDKDWGEIVDLSLYNGNLYLLDKGKDEVWKYLNTGDGFGGKNSYFQKGEAVDLASISSLSIDGALYLAGDKMIFKYLSGVREKFKLNLPDKEFSFDKVFTNNNLEKIYLWDKGKGVIYVLGKNGEYVEQISSSILSKGDDFVVYDNKILVLFGSKIYQIK